MNNFVRLFGGGLGAAIAVTLAGGANIPPLDTSSLGGAVLLLAWIAAWVVIGYSIRRRRQVWTSSSSPAWGHPSRRWTTCARCTGSVAFSP